MKKFLTLIFVLGIMGNYYAGGIIGYNSDPIITNCSNTGGIVNCDNYAGGILGN